VIDESAMVKISEAYLDIVEKEDWGFPFLLPMLANFLNEEFSQKSVMPSNQCIIFSYIMDKIIQKSVKKFVHGSLETLKLTRYAKSEQKFEEILLVYKDLVTTLALSWIFHNGILTGEQKIKIKPHCDFLNEFPIASVAGDRVSFASQNFAEYFVAEQCVQKLQKNTSKRTTLSNEQLKCILLNNYKFARKCINEMLSPNKCHYSSLDLDDDEKEKLLKNLIEEDLYDLYLMVKDQIGYKPDMRIEGQIDPFVLALQSTRTQFVKEFLYAGDDIVKQAFNIYSNEISKLRYTIENGLYEILKENINSWKDVDCDIINYCDCFEGPEDSIFGLAIQLGNLETVELLIRHGGIVCCELLRQPISQGNQDLVDLLITRGKASVAHGLKYAAKFDKMDLMRKHIGNIPQAGKRNSLTKALGKAVSNGHFNVVKELCALGAVPADLENVAVSGLGRAATEGHLECLQFVIERGVHVDQRCGCFNSTLLMHAAKAHREHLVKYLLKKGANVKAIDMYGNKCLHYAALGGSMRCAEILVDAGAEIDSQNREGVTPLMKVGSYHCARYLLQKSANPNLKDKDGRTCLYYAARKDPKIVALLAMHMANI
jgi:ankyrin repeat protein